MTRFMLVLAMAIALPAAAAPSINSSYRVTGDIGAAPVQVFDNGSEVFVQLRDVTRVPAPFVGGAMADYTVRGNYLVLPLTPTFELRLGAAVVRVERAGVPGGRVAEVFSSVDALNQPAPPTVAIPAPIPMPPVTLFAGTGGVTGDILIEGETSSAPAAPQSTGRQFPHGNAGVPRIFSEARGRHVRVVADGTVAGARDAQRLRGLCTISGPSRCDINYSGAPRGVTTLEVL